jgi:hypothetical protein
MKNLIYLILAFFIAISCHHKEEITSIETDINELEVGFGTPVLFVGTILGQNLIIEEGKGGWQNIHANTYPGFKIDFVEGKNAPQAIEATISCVVAQIINNNMESKIMVGFPVMKIDDYNDINQVRELIKIGKKQFHTGDITSVRNGFSISYNSYFTMTGVQENNGLEIINIAEDKSPVDAKTTVFRLLIQVPNCKLYDKEGKEVGEIKNMRFATQFNYKPYEQPD